MATKPAQTQVCPETFTPEAIEAAALAIKQFEVGKHARLSLTDPWRHWELNRGRAALTAALPLLPSGQGSLRAQLIGISERLRDEVPAAAIPAVRDAVIQLRILGESLPAPPSIEKIGGKK